MDEGFVRAVQDLHGHPERLPVAGGAFSCAAVWLTVVRGPRPDLLSNPWADVEAATGDITDLVAELLHEPLPQLTSTGIVPAVAFIGPRYLLRSGDGDYARPPERAMGWEPSTKATNAALFKQVGQVPAYTDETWDRRLRGLE